MEKQTTHSSKPETGLTYMRYLDGLRCLSILWVILIHLQLQGDKVFTFIAGHGWMGVDMFFVISGFLITSILLREKINTGRISLRRFYIRRILRIWPAYYLLVFLTLGAAVAILAFHITSGTVWADMIRHTIMWPAMYLTNAYAGFMRTENCALLISWSLSLEEQFYLLWPLLLFWNTRTAWKIALCAILAITAWRTWLTFHITPGVFAMRRLFYAPDTRMDVILYGALLAFLLIDEQRVAAVRNVLRRPWLPVAWAAGFVMVIYINNRWSGRIGNSVGYSASAFMMAIGIAYLQTVRPPGILRILEWRPFTYVGRISYGIYLFHGLVILLVAHMFGPPTDTAAKIAYALSVYALSIAVAAFSYRFYESRFLRLKEHFASLPSAAKAPGTASQSRADVYTPGISKAARE